MTSEHQRIERIRALFARQHEAVVHGIGDDCAVLAEAAGQLVWTVDAAVQDVHFSLEFMSPQEVGYRSFMAAASDIAAMGAHATAALCSLQLPSSFSDAALDALLAGQAEAADLLGIAVVGGNLARARELSVSTTVLGRSRERLLYRHGARAGEGLFVTGCLGAAALGLVALRAGRARDGDYAQPIERFLRPRARLDVASEVAKVASACMDISDGLMQDLAHLCRASAVGATVELWRLPFIADFAELARALGADPTALALSGGEDYELLFTADPRQVPRSLATRIGTIHAASGVRALDETGQERAPDLGFDHFRVGPG